MTDILLELLRAVAVGLIVLFLLRGQYIREVRNVDGWQSILLGFVLIFFGTLIDITDNFNELNRFVIVGDTPVQAFLEKIVGYLSGFLLVSIGIGRWSFKVVEHQRIISELSKKTEKELKILQGFLPICASCKKIRDEKGYWKQIEVYISEHSEVKFTHSICPDCAKKVYSEFDKSLKGT